MANQYGDYQTPSSLVKRVLSIVKTRGFDFENVIEPTFGKGSFIEGIPKVLQNTRTIKGLEIQESYYNEALTKTVKHIDYELYNKDFFSFDLSTLFSSHHSNLVVGNLPWVTVSQLSAFESKNIPKKANIKGLSGYDALTGKSNFDIAEYMSLSLLNIMSTFPSQSVMALLVKNTVAKNIIKYIPSSNLRPTTFNIYRFDAKKEFNASADACLMMIGFNTKSQFDNSVNEYSLYSPDKLIKKFGWSNNKFVSNISAYKQSCLYDNSTMWDWRSGIKHDASKIMELRRDGEEWVNGLKERYSDDELSKKYIYPLVKSSDVRKQHIHRDFRKYVIVTQQKPKQDTSHIKVDSPTMWQYLKDHREFFDKRKSSIYRNSAPFSIFGVGDYSFKPYKVAISGMYKKPIFSILPPKNGKPVMTDDTVYFVGFDIFLEANIFAAILNGEKTNRLLSSITFSDAKRPYTKDILKRVDIISILKATTLRDLNQSAFSPIDSNDVTKFIDKYDNDLSLF
ncbi:hypothetical protein [Limosilactobacillus antri]|nr:hypothetical protein [Limosilactobacillus antri]